MHRAKHIVEELDPNKLVNPKEILGIYQKMYTLVSGIGTPDLIKPSDN